MASTSDACSVASPDISHSTNLKTKVQMKGNRYENPWSTWRDPTASGFLKYVFLTKNHSPLPSEQVLNQTLPVEKPDFSQFASSPESGVRHMWIGHSSSLVQFDGITLLTDPVFSDKNKRYRPPPCTVEELPKVDCVVISHNHYDHLDLSTVEALNNKFRDALRWYVPMGMASWMRDRGCTNVVELLWWDEHIYLGKQGNVKFVCTPCQHWSQRTPFDTNKALWSSWAVVGPKHRYYFAGDSGYCAGFKEIGEHVGPFTLASIPIGAFSPRDFLSPQHMDPIQAIDVHTDVKSQNSVGIHWGTLKQGREYYLEPPQMIKEELEKRKMNPSEFVTVRHGEIRVFTDQKSDESVCA